MVTAEKLGVSRLGIEKMGERMTYQEAVDAAIEAQHYAEIKRLEYAIEEAAREKRVGDIISDRFDSFGLTNGQIESVKRLTGYARNLASVICDECPEGREMSLSLTNLEQAVMWANKAISRG